MNKSRVTGIILLIIGIIGHNYFNHPIMAFILGATVTIGIALIILGRPIFKGRK